MKLIYCTALLLAAGSAQAASNVSARYDGSYQGAAMPVPSQNAVACPAFSIADMIITKGVLRASASEGHPAVSGFITEEGYVSAFMTRPGHQRSPMDGRLEDGIIVAGFIEADSNCSWVVRFSRRP